MRDSWDVILLVGICLFLLAVLFASAEPAPVTLTWTAPGDDGMTGTATVYDLRYAGQPPALGDTITWWQSAARASGLPLPSASGVTDSVVVLLPPGNYWFNIRVADEVPNWSSWSNWLNVLIAAPDTIPPAPVRDLRVVVWPNPTSDGRFPSESGGE